MSIFTNPPLTHGKLTFEARPQLGHVMILRSQRRFLGPASPEISFRLRAQVSVPRCGGRKFQRQALSTSKQESTEAAHVGNRVGTYTHRHTQYTHNIHTQYTHTHTE